VIAWIARATAAAASAVWWQATARKATHEASLARTPWRKKGPAEQAANARRAKTVECEAAARAAVHAASRAVFAATARANAESAWAEIARDLIEVINETTNKVNA
jgi:hypothetical protein